MQRIERIADLRRQVAAWRKCGGRIAFVPTMGNLHAGHISLVEQARQIADHVVVSVFVNPMQFGPDEDFDRYPRTLAEDSAKLEAASTDLLFAPPVEEVYPDGSAVSTQVSVPGVSQGMCGDHRPGHFVGVATVVAKLFNIVQPDVALFGEKDYQQLQVIRRMVDDLCMPVEIIGVPTKREADGLAMSSRNGYLGAAERAIAPALYAVLQTIAVRLEAGERDVDLLEREGAQALRDAGFKPEYLNIRSAEGLTVPTQGERELVILAAAYLGKTRLIDNIRLSLLK